MRKTLSLLFFALPVLAGAQAGKIRGVDTLYKQPAIRMLDGNYFVRGFGWFGIRLTNNHVLDSTEHNFYNGSGKMDVIPYNNVRLAGERISIDLVQTTLLSVDDSVIVAPADQSRMAQGFIDNKPYIVNGRLSGAMGMTTNSYPPDTVSVQDVHYGINDQLEIRLSLNGKVLSDWTPLDRYSRQVFRKAGKFAPSKYKDNPNVKPMPAFWNASYGFGYHIAETKLKPNDQLLIEIKEDQKNWMLDRFNIMRVSTGPSVAAVAAGSIKKEIPVAADMASVEKKTSHYHPDRAN